MAKKFWCKLSLQIMLIIAIFSTINVKAATCTNGTIQGTYTSVNTSTTWTNFTNTFSLTPPNTIINMRIALTNSNIKNNKLLYTGTIKLYNTLTSSVNTNPNISIRYGTANSFSDITTNCTIQYKRTNLQESLRTEWEIKYTCQYQGSNINANFLQIWLYGSNHFITNGAYSDICLKISPNDTDTIISNDNNNTTYISNQMYEEYLSLWDKGDEIEEVVRYESSVIQETLTVYPHGEFTINSSVAENIEDKEEILKGNLYNPYEDGNLGNYLASTSNDTKYTNGIQWIWNIIDRMIGYESVIWILTSIILTLGIIKVVLSR